MKKLFLLGLAVTLFIACQNQPQRYFSESAEIDSFKAGIANYESQNWDVWVTQFADTAKIFHNGNKATSAAESAENHKGMLANFSKYGFSKENAETEMIVDNDGDTWVNYWATWLGKFKESDKKLSIPVHITAQYINGKIVQEFAYYDTAPLVAAIAEIEAAKMAAEAESEATE